MTPLEFFEAYSRGQRHFQELDFEYVEGFTRKDFSNVVLESCFLYVDFRGSNLTNAQFIECNIKEIDLRNTNLTNAVMNNCSVESAMFKGTTTMGFKFIENYCYGATVGQQAFEQDFSEAG